MLAVTAEPDGMSAAIVSTTKPHVCAPIDANGNLTSDGTKTYVWNARNQLVEVKEGSTTVATFEYDGAGRRTEKVAAGLTHQYLYDAEDIVEERITGSSSDTIRYHHGIGIDEPLARKNSSDVVTYYLADHLGSVVQESSAAGAVTLEREYDPWGSRRRALQPLAMRSRVGSGTRKRNSIISGYGSILLVLARSFRTIQLVSLDHKNPT